ncbi:hypothetical protein BON30_03835 [Cystobacter ferrugineus]|uniref:NAD glycohydrolase translocation F5/8 type C domain-containing protein n=1 Tax=Cystobacter ferrugineus TaxID=83449 RepID=A0A1L9BJ50_9BACT|nr:hypothetical protein [Cystobacter ferrugineus]OJH42344.1 hypothetical protein BON30_03835 [Cystobacter ferrugineus]
MATVSALVAAGTAWAAKPCSAWERVSVGEQKARACASSTLAPKARYRVKNAFDGNVGTAWVEGAKGPGAGEWVVLEFEQPVSVYGMWVVPGYTKSMKTFLQNRVPRRLELQVDEQPKVEYELRYHVDLDEEEQQPRCRLTANGINMAARLIIFRQPVKGKRWRLTMKGWVESPQAKYEDMALSEWAPLVEGARVTAGGPLVEAVSERLRHYASKEALDSGWIDAGAQVEDVLAPRGDLGAEWMKEGVREELQRTGAEAGRTPTENFSKVARGALLDAPVTLWTQEGHHYVVGAQLFSVGDGEWVEYHPVLRLGTRYEVESAGAWISGDGAPGCHDVLPLPPP